MKHAPYAPPSPSQVADSGEQEQRRSCLAVAVGTIITDRPPHRSVRALLRIRLPPRMAGVKALHRIRMEDARDWNPSIHEPVEPVHGDTTALAAPR